jgi:hypothetical protein
MLVSLQGVWTSVTRVAREQSATVSSVTGRGIAWVNQTISKGVKELRAWHWPRLNRQKGERLDVGPLDKRIVLVGVGTLTLASIALVSYLAWRPAPPGGIEPASSPTVSVTIDATPWAIVKEIRGEDGRVWPFESDGSTPLVLELPPGRYVVSVMGPGDQPRTVEMTVGADNNDPVRIPFDSGINVYDYFDQYLRPFEDPATGAVRTTPPPLPPK